MFYTYVAYVFQWLFKRFQAFLPVFQTHISSVSSVFRCTLQIFLFEYFKNKASVDAGDPPTTAGVRAGK
jgi:hypothetical protein